MKCPKCHYLSFEPEPRCRNCGYDLTVPPEPELEIRTSTPYEGPFLDLNLKPRDEERARPDRNVVTLGAIDLDRVVGEAEPPDAPTPESETNTASHAPEPDDALEAVVQATTAPQPPPLRVVPAPDRPARRDNVTRRQASGRSKPAPSTTAELPLFVKKRPEHDPDAPLVTVPATPSVPIAVRRAHDTPRPRSASRTPAGNGRLGPLERDLLHDLKRLEQRVAERAREESASQAESDPGVVARRLIAAAIDATLLGSISAGVLWATLRLCDLGLGELATLPLVPLAAFLLLVAVGYLVMFTVAGGQTVGKMLAGIRVVGTDDADDHPLTPRQAAVRALLTLPSVLAFGLGFLPALGRHHRALHDRLSHTRVVPA